MGVGINSNIASLQGQRFFSRSTEAVGLNFERLSSGLRINHASDDAAGLAIATDLGASSRIYSKALLNINDGISVLSIADGSLDSISQVVIRLKELGEQAANGVYSTAQRRSLFSEADALIAEFNRVTSSTKFNGIQILDNSLNSLTLQTGFDNIVVGVGTDLARKVGTGTYTAGTALTGSAVPQDSEAIDINRDGKLDFISVDFAVARISVHLGNGDGTFLAKQYYTTSGNSGAVSITTGDLNGDGYADVVTGTGSTVAVLLGNGDGSFRALMTRSDGNGVSDVQVADLNGDQILDIATRSTTDGVINVSIGNGDGTFQALVSYASTTGATTALAIGDINGDGSNDIVSTGVAGGGGVVIMINNGDGTFKARTTMNGGNTPSGINLGDVNLDGYLDIVNASQDGKVGVLIGNGNGTFKARVSYDTSGTGLATLSCSLADLNGDGNLDIMATESGATSHLMVLFGNGDGTYRAKVTTLTGFNPMKPSIGDYNSDGVLDAVTNAGTLFTAVTTNTTTLPRINLFTQASARSSLATMDGALSRIALERGRIGSHLSRLTSAYATLQTSRLNYDAAASRIIDVDVASETASLTGNQILQQVGVAVLAQASQQPALALKLLGNS